MKTIILICTILILSLFVLKGTGESYIIVYDDIAIKGEKVFLRAEAKGKLFKKSGKLIEFFLNNKLLGKRLSGGDGFALLEFTPSKTGKNKIKAKLSGNSEEGEGILLSLNKGQEIILIEIERILYKNIFNKEPIKDSLKGVTDLSRKYPVVYVYSDSIDIINIRNWLKTYLYPEYPVLSIKNGSLISEIIEKGLKIKAIICSSKFIEYIKEYKVKAYTFESSDYAQEVDSWNEILKMIK